MSPKKKSHDIAGRQQTGEALDKSKEHFQALFDNLLEGVQILGHDWRYLYLNASAEKHNRRPNGELLGRKYMDMWPGIEETHVYTVIERCMQERIASQLENRFVYPDGTVGWFVLSIQPIPEGVFILSFDITERVRAEKQVEQMKRLYATLSQVNQTIVRVKEAGELYRSICNVAVQFGEFSLAWIGLLDEASGDVKPVAANGLDVNQWPFPIVNVKRGPHQNGVISQAFHTSTVVTSEDIQTDKRIKSIKSLHDLIQEHDYHSLAAVPFHLRDRTIGVLNLVSREVGLFEDQGEVRLLEEMGLDISFALDTMDAERTRRQWADAFEHCAHGIVIGDPKTNQIRTCNPAFAREQRGTIQEFSSMPLLDMYAPSDREQIKHFITQSDRAGSVQFEANKIRKDGSVYPVQMDLVSVRDEHGNLLYRVATQQDISERKRVEAQQGKLAERLDLATQSANMGIWDWDIEKNEIVWDDRMYALYGLKPGEFGGAYEAWLQGVHPDDRAPSNEISAQAVRGEREYNTEFRVLWPDGSMHWLKADGQVFRDEHGMPLRMVGVNYDITERKLAEEVVRDSQARLSGIIDSAMDAIISLNSDQRIVLFNPAAEQMFGCSADKAIGQPLDRFIPARFRASHRKHIRAFGMSNRAMRTMGTLGPLTCLRTSGEEFPAEITISQTEMAGQKIYTAILRDATERVRAEQALQASERALKLFVEYAPAAIAMFDRDMNYIAASRRYISDYRLADEIVVGRSHYEVFPEIPERWKEIHRRCLAGAIEQAEEDPFIRDNGTLDWIRWEIHPWYEKPGEIGGIVLFSEVITERKQAEARLHESEERFRRYFELGLIGMAITSPTKGILEVNDQICAIFGYERNELLRMTWAELTHPDDLTLDNEQFNRVMAGKIDGYSVEKRWIRKDGQVIHSTISVKCLRRIDSSVDYFIALVQDITERKQAEKALHESETRFRSLIENSSDEVSIVNVDGKLMYESPTANPTLGYKPGEFLDQNIFQLIHPDDLERVQDQFARLMQDPNLHPREQFRLRHQNGNWRWVEAVGTNLLSEPSVRGIVINYYDITERKQVEQALHVSERRYRALFENSPVSIWEEDFSRVKKHLDSLKQQGISDFQAYFASHPEFVSECAGMIDILDVNNAALQMYRAASKEELIAGTVLGLSKGELEHIHEDFIAIAEGRFSHAWEGADEMLTGDAIEISLSWSVVPGHEQDYSRVIVTTIDITERKRAETALAQNEQRFRALTEHAPDGIVIYGSSGRIEYSSPATSRVMGYSTDEMIDANPVQITHPDDLPSLLLVLNELLQAPGKTIRTQYRMRHKEGSWRWLESSVSNFSESPGIGGLVFNFRDITERKQAEEALQQSEERHRQVSSLISDYVYSGAVFPDGKTNTEWASGAFEQITGYTLEEINQLPAGFLTLALPEDLEKIMSQQPELFEQGSLSIEYRIRRKDGEIRWLRDYINYLSGEGVGKSARLIGAVQDITKQVQAEREIQHRNEDLLIINTLNEALNRGEDIEGIIEVFARETRNVFACNDVAIYLLDHEEKYIEMQNSTLPRRATERIEKLIGRPIPKIQIPVRQDGYFRKIMANEQGIMTSDPKVIQQWIEEFTETTFLPTVVRPVIRKIIPQIYKVLNIGSTISIPLISSGRTIGILDMSSEGLFTEEDLRRIHSISYQVTAVIMRKQAEKQVQLQLSRMSALSEIDRAISSSLDMRLSLDVVLSEVLAQLGVDAAAVLLLNEAHLTLEYCAGKGFRTLAIRQSRMRLGDGYAGQVGLERKLLHVPNLPDAGAQFTRPDLLKNEGFVEYFGVPLVAKGLLKGVLEIFHRTPLRPDLEWVNYLETLGGQTAIAIDNAQLFEGMQKSNLELIAAYDATIAGWSHAMDLRDKETEGHSQRVTELTLILANQMGISEQEQVHIRRGALLHDIGKLGVPDQILLKTGKLIEEEWALMRRHPTYAFEMLSPISYLRPALDIPYCHHEKWDGTGYPRGLRGEQIPLAARIFAVVDVWDALTSDRPYRSAWATKKTLQYIKEQSGQHFDPKIVDVFLKAISSDGTIATSATSFSEDDT